jgi:SAM-dependent methyltransferase/uncharacterized protein YbaR (Trm112 family)
VRPDLFEQLAPVCPRCLHGQAGEHPLIVAERAEERAGRLWHGILHCSNSACWLEFPVIDGVPVIVTDPRGFLQNAGTQVLARDDLPEGVAGLLGDALGPGGDFDTTRQHLSIYAQAHFSDWAGGRAPDMLGTLDAGLTMLGEVRGPAIDLGGAVGRGGWELARIAAPVLVADLNIAFLRLAQRLALEGEARFDRRRVGLVYDRTRAALPAELAEAQVDFWAVDAMALPFRPGVFGLATAINLVDSITGPTEAVAEAARVLRPRGGAVWATPHDWSANAAEPARWMGGHSQRRPTRGAAEPVLTATLKYYGLEPVAELHELPWTLCLHDRAEMRYRLHLVACRKRM